MTVVGRSKLDHPALGTVGGSSLHTSIETMWTAVSDHLGSRFKSYSSQSNSTTVTYEHNFGKELSTLQVHIYTGSAGNLTKVKDPTAAGWVIAATSGFLKTKVDVTTPSTGGPHTFVVSVHEDEKSLDNLSITGTAGQGYVDVTTQSSAPSSPASGDVRIYSKTDGKLYKKDSSGNEAAVGAGTGSGGVNYLVDWYDATKAVGTVSTVAAGGNVTVSGSFPAVTSAWYADATSGSAAIASSSDNTLRSTANYLTALSGVSTSGATFVQSPVFNIDGKDLGTALTVQFDVSGNTTDNDWDVVAVRYNSSGVYQELIPIAGNVSTMTGTPSAKLPLGVKQFNGFFITGSTASDVYAIRFRRRAGSVQIRLDSLTVGPQQVLQGYLGTDWKTFTPTWTNLSLQAGYYAKWRRVGPNMEVYIEGLVAADSAGVIELSTTIDGYVVDTANLGVRAILGTGSLATAGQLYNVNVLVDGGIQFKLYAHNQGSLGNTVPSADGGVDTGDRLSVLFSAPIVGWQSNTQQAARAVEEYASNFNTGDTNDTSSFAYGPAGSTTPGALTSSKTKRVRFQTPILPTDTLFLEIRLQTSGANWMTLATYDNQSGIGLLQRQGSRTFGIGLNTVVVNNTDVDVSFGSFAYPSATTYNADGQAWATNMAYWRVRKVSSGAAVGFPVGARNVVADSSVSTVPSGVVGWSQTTNVTANQNCGASGAWFDARSINFSGKPGKYLVYGCIHYKRNSATFTEFYAYAGWSTNAGNSPTGLNTGDNMWGQDLQYATTNWSAQSVHACPAVVITDSTGTITSINGTAFSGVNLYLKGITGTYTAGTPVYNAEMHAVLIG